MGLKDARGKERAHSQDASESCKLSKKSYTIIVHNVLLQIV